MTRPKQKYIEQQYLDIFSKKYKLPKGDIEPCEKPDFIINGDERIGIEVTNLYIQHGHEIKSEQRQNILRKLTLKHAQSLYCSKYKNKFEYWFGFDPEIPIIKPKKFLKKYLTW